MAASSTCKAVPLAMSTSRFLPFAVCFSAIPIGVANRSEGPLFWRSRANDLPAWPWPATTDSEGRFSLHGIGRDLRAFLTVNDPRYAQQDIEIETDGDAASKQLKVTLQPARSSSVASRMPTTASPSATPS